MAAWRGTIFAWAGRLRESFTVDMREVSVRHHIGLSRNIKALKMRYLHGVGVILPGLLNCFLTCVAGAFANVAFERWSQSSWDLLTRRILVGYLGAVGVVILVLPWIHQFWIARRRARQQN